MNQPRTTAELLHQLERRKHALDLVVERLRALHEPAFRQLGSQLEGPRAMVRAEAERWLAHQTATPPPVRPAAVRA